MSLITSIFQFVKNCIQGPFAKTWQHSLRCGVFYKVFRCHPQKKNWGRSCYLLPLHKEKLWAHLLAFMARKWQTPVCFCAQTECIPVIHWSHWVSVYISYIRGQNVLWHLLKSFQSRQNYNVQNNVFVEGCSSLFLESVKIQKTSANHRNKKQIRNVQVAHIKGHSFYNSALVQAT